MEKIKRTILILTAGYLPGYLAGGPIRTLASLVQILGEEFDFKIVTLDRDLGSKNPYNDVIVNEWQTVGNAHVFYVSPKNVTLSFFRHLLNDTEHDVLYLNSFFCHYFSIIPLMLKRFGLIKSFRIIIAPRGQFSAGALNIKSFKKTLYLVLFKFLQLHKAVIWQASSLYELRDIQSVIDNTSPEPSGEISIMIAPNLSTPTYSHGESFEKNKIPGFLKVVFLSRVSPMKNLKGALEMISVVNGKIDFNIFGPLEDMNYWKECLRIIDTLPPNIHVRYQGAVEPDNVVNELSNNDIFFLPTLGENFGHVILEALVAGCPVLISDQTPWRHLEEKKIGWDFSLADPEKFITVLNYCMAMGYDEFMLMSSRAQEYGVRKATDPDIVEQNRKLLNSNLVRCS